MDTAFRDEDQQQQPNGINTSHAPETSEDPLSVSTVLPEIEFEILSRLPVRSLLRCKAVCKLWCSIISDPYFIKSHLDLSTKNNNHAHHKLTFGTVPRNIYFKGCSLYDVLHDEPVNVRELDYSFGHPRQCCRIVGSCNGLLLVASQKISLFIWNPSTRRSYRLPNCASNELCHLSVFYGFGYDESNDDYKVVVISCIFKTEDQYGTEVKMYSLKTGKVKKISDFPHGMPMDYFGKFSSGALHWAAGEDFGSDMRTIVSLDLAKETFGEVSQPVYDEGDKDVTFGALAEKLCVLCKYPGNHADLWVMQVYGVKDSWIKLVSIPFLADLGRDLSSVPLCISNDGKVVFRLGQKLVVYDLNNDSSSEIQILHENFEAYTYVESLVSPDAPAGLGDNNEDGNLRNI